ncbi:hypothetical protein [Acinetobacter sp. HY1485]|nr:hypothetical protein [Acinetobacter sp. HY1485]
MVGQAQTLVVGLAKTMKSNVKEGTSIGNEAQMIASTLKKFDITRNILEV